MGRSGTTGFADDVKAVKCFVRWGERQLFGGLPRETLEMIMYRAWEPGKEMERFKKSNWVWKERNQSMRRNRPWRGNLLKVEIVEIRATLIRLSSAPMTGHLDSSRIISKTSAT